MAERPDAGEANRLYWETDASVAEIATKLDLSRRALYEAVRPAPAGVSCVSCGQSVQYENRSARRLGQAFCPACGARQSIPTAAIAEPPLAVVSGNARGDARALVRDDDIRHRAVLLGGAAIAGVAIGTVAALLAMRRD
jgi:UDP-N-acetylmuramyl tripeptide synthase